ncbi:transcription termination/antitermination NusG family protein [Pseudophaeobacter sp.]|uniref:transcription termination/antitermination NusG family protein n=1 Tax=Pseudophaeobacter sp. TaxID=1971739 RepID=UPI00329A7581
MGYEIGQQLRPSHHRGLTGDPLQTELGEPYRHWYILKVAALQEFVVQEWLRDEPGVVDAWLPTEKAWRNQPIGRRRRIPYKKKIAPGYVFVCVDRQIAWDVLRHQSNGKVLGVVGRDDKPMPVPEDQMRAMKKLPKTIQKIYAEQEAARAIVAGMKARIKDDCGVMAGWVVDVSEVNGGIAKVLVPLFGGRSAKLDAKFLEKHG